MTPENRDIPDWAHQERQGDFDWLRENLDAFWATATAAFEDAGRGAMVVDTTLQPVPGTGHPFAYFPQDQVEEQGDEDTRRMVAEYDPIQEFVVVLLKPGDRVSTYRVSVVLPEPQEAVTGKVIPSYTSEPTTKPKLRPPDMETLIEWEAEGGCEAACPHRCWVEPDGHCPHGNPSWLLKMGFI
jgi:hypothetical protein